MGVMSIRGLWLSTLTLALTVVLVACSGPNANQARYEGSDSWDVLCNDLSFQLGLFQRAADSVESGMSAQGLSQAEQSAKAISHIVEHATDQGMDFLEDEYLFIPNAKLAADMYVHVATYGFGEMTDDQAFGLLVAVDDMFQEATDACEVEKQEG